MGSVVVVDQAALARCPGGPVVPDGSSHSQKPLSDAGVEARGGPAAVSFQVELAFEGVVDRFDPLPDPADGPVAGGLVAAVGPDQAQPEPGGDQVLELPPGEALVADEDAARPQRAGPGGVRQQPGRHLAFPDPGAGQAPGHG